MTSAPLPLPLILEIDVSSPTNSSAGHTSENGTDGGSLPCAAEDWIQFSVSLGKLIGQELGKQKSVFPLEQERAEMDVPSA